MRESQARPASIGQKPNTFALASLKATALDIEGFHPTLCSSVSLVPWLTPFDPTSPILQCFVKVQCVGCDALGVDAIFI